MSLLKSRRKHTVVVSADLQSLISTHNQTSLSILLVLQQSHVTGTTLSPLVGFTDKLEELCTHLEGLLLEFLVGLDVNLLRKTDDWLEVNILGLWCLLLYPKIQ